MEKEQEMLLGELAEFVNLLEDREDLTLEDAKRWTTDELMNTIYPVRVDPSVLPWPSVCEPCCLGAGPCQSIHPCCLGAGPCRSIHPCCLGAGPCRSIHPCCLGAGPCRSIHPCSLGALQRYIGRLKDLLAASAGDATSPSGRELEKLVSVRVRRTDRRA
jgi:hypothetical protein